MKWLAVPGLLVLAACGHPAPAGDPDARGPTPVEGDWTISWTCTSCQPGQINPLAYARDLTIAGDTATYSNPDCADCGDEHTGTPSGDGTCFDVDAGGTDLTWDAYQLCSLGDHLQGDVTFTGYPGPPEARTYRLSGARP